MDEIAEQAKEQLMMVEHIYDLKIINCDEVAGLIAVVIPYEVLSKLFETTRWQGKHA
jgi:hypothetical protein